MADQLIAFEALLFPCDGRPPHLVALMTSPPASGARSGARTPHPEHYMSFVADGLGSRAWTHQLVESLDGMNRKFARPYILFWPTVSRDGMAFPANKCIRTLQGAAWQEAHCWRGDIIFAKYNNEPFSSMVDASMADFPLLKNYLMTHPGPPQ